MKNNILFVGCGSRGFETAILATLSMETETVAKLEEPEVFEITRNVIKDLPEVLIEPDIVPFSKFREKKHNHKHIAKRKSYNHRRR